MKARFTSDPVRAWHGWSAELGTLEMVPGASCRTAVTPIVDMPGPRDKASDRS
jgi:hypothetical protein